MVRQGEDFTKAQTYIKMLKKNILPEVKGTEAVIRLWEQIPAFQIKKIFTRNKSC